MLAGHLALIVAAIFSGAAFYINVVEQPARLVLDDRSLLVEWKVSYKRATVLQAPQTVVAFLLGLVAWWQTSHSGWLVGALLMLAIAPVTFLVIFPVNNALMATAPEQAGPQSRASIGKWALLHAIRTILSFAALLAFLWASLA